MEGQRQRQRRGGGGEPRAQVAGAELPGVPRSAAGLCQKNTPPPSPLPTPRHQTVRGSGACVGRCGSRAWPGCPGWVWRVGGGLSAVRPGSAERFPAGWSHPLQLDVNVVISGVFPALFYPVWPPEGLCAARRGLGRPHAKPDLFNYLSYAPPICFSFMIGIFSFNCCSVGDLFFFLFILFFKEGIDNKTSPPFASYFNSS